MTKSLSFLDSRASCLSRLGFLTARTVRTLELRPVAAPRMENQMEKKMENEMETLGPVKGVYRDISYPIKGNQVEKKWEMTWRMGLGVDGVYRGCRFRRTGYIA